MIPMKRNMFGFPERLYREARKDFRVREKVPITWTVQNGSSGIGHVSDISTSGALIEARGSRPLTDGTVISFKSETGAQGGFLPPKAKVVWSRPSGLLKRRVLCGVEFSDSSPEETDRLKKRIDERIHAFKLG
ncbi:MAG: PilZ domain-containing protein, partial [Candidatus Omnitrophica bacterium]|nr:PilZ domain-containing protein [Candidatus Omnitrophota bacterium]